MANLGQSTRNNRYVTSHFDSGTWRNNQHNGIYVHWSGINETNQIAVIIIKYVLDKNIKIYISHQIGYKFFEW